MGANCGPHVARVGAAASSDGKPRKRCGLDHAAPSTDWHSDANTNTHASTDPDADANTHAVANTYPSADANTDTNTHTNTHTHTHANPDANTDSGAHANTRAAACDRLRNCPPTIRPRRDYRPRLQRAGVGWAAPPARHDDDLLARWLADQERGKCGGHGCLRMTARRANRRRAERPSRPRAGLGS